MLRFDPNDPVDRLLLKELHGEVVSFNEWLDAMEDLEDEPDCAQILQERGLRREDGFARKKRWTHFVGQSGGVHADRGGIACIEVCRTTAAVSTADTPPEIYVPFYLSC